MIRQAIATVPRRLFISFSGGETSAYMTLWLLKNAAAYTDVAIVFANTGKEREETLEFVQECDEKLFGNRVVWVEAVVHHRERKACTHRVVDFATASRAGEPFEEFIQKYGIPNQKFPACTRELKLRPMQSYLRSIGWGTDYDTAIGIRADEIDRVNPKHRELRIVYPLAGGRFGSAMTKPQINAFWQSQPFRLRLKGYEGNCDFCWKKSLRKHLTILSEAPSVYDFPALMEERYGGVGAEFNKTPPPPAGYRRTFFRGNRSTNDLRLAVLQPFDRAPDDASVYPAAGLFDQELDAPGGGCSESCEVFHDLETPPVEQD